MLGQICITILTTLALTACANNPTPTQTPIPPPPPLPTTCNTLNCWDGLVPGVTTYNAAKTIMGEQYSIKESKDSQYFSWQTDANSDYSGGSVEVDEQGVIIYVNIWFLEGQLTIEELIARFGEPEQVWVSIWNCAGSGIVYREHGIWIDLHPEGMSIGVSPTQSIAELSLEILEKVEDWQYVTDVAWFEWQGYTQYCDYLE